MVQFEYIDVGDLTLLNEIHRNNVFKFEQLSQDQKQLFANFINQTLSTNKILLVDSVSAELVGSDVLYVWGDADNIKDSIAVNAVVN